MLKLAGKAAVLVAVSYVLVQVLNGSTAFRLGPRPADAQKTTPAQDSMPRGMLVLPEDGRGHFIAEPLVNGTRLNMLVDTGASVVALSAEDAGRAGIFPNAGEYKLTIATANGTIQAAPVKLREVRVGSIVLRDVEAAVLPAGRLKESLLGMSFLRRLSSFQIADGSLVLKQ
jgi:aspartyl protease family protein